MEEREKWRVVYSPDSTVNAFTYPGGQIVLHKGILDLAENADQAAMVLSHEISHSLLRHSNRNISNSILVGLFKIGLSFCLDLSPDELIVMGKSGGIGLSQYSKAQESAADIWGLRLLEQAGFDIREGPKIFDIMDQYDKSKETTSER